MFKTIVVGFDGSDHAVAALEMACDLAGKYEAALHVVNAPQAVGDTLIVGYSAVPIPPTPEALENAGAEMRKRAGEIVEKHGATVDYHIKEGDPGRIIVEQAKAVDADLIIMGRRGLGNLGGLLIGSTTNRVSQLADCAVLTLK